MTEHTEELSTLLCAADIASPLERIRQIARAIEALGRALQDEGQDGLPIAALAVSIDELVDRAQDLIRAGLKQGDAP